MLKKYGNPAVPTNLDSLTLPDQKTDEHSVLRIVLGLEYAGAPFLGWQSQTHRQTVQDALETALAYVAGHRCITHCAGRTDAGVHACIQVVHFETTSARPLSAWVRGVNAFLPPSVSVLWARLAPADFHARFSAVARRYRYLLLNTPVRPAVFPGHFGWFHRPLCLKTMQQACSCLPGHRDFSAFRSAQCQAKTPFKHLYEARIAQHGPLFVFDFEANGFLHHMVRNLVGSLLMVGKGKQPVSWFESLVEKAKTASAGPTFMPDGLYLCGISYPASVFPEESGRFLRLPPVFAHSPD
jgi:tRNA pseudouridine38-40 synthase